MTVAAALSDTTDRSFSRCPLHEWDNGCRDRRTITVVSFLGCPISKLVIPVASALNILPRQKTLSQHVIGGDVFILLTNGKATTTSTRSSSIL